MAVPARDHLFRLVRDAAAGLPSRVVVPPSDVAALDDDNRSWVARFGLVTDDASIRRHAAIRCASFAAHTYAQCSDVIARLGADLISWLYLFDDAHGEPDRDLTSFELAVRTGEVAPDPTVFHAALFDLRARGSELAGSRWIDQLATSLARYFRGCRNERVWRHDRIPPPLATYRAIRSESVGAYPVFDLIELHTGVLADDDRRLVETARFRAAQLCAWVNDIYSFPKELASGEPLNLVTVIAHHDDVSHQRALAEAVRIFTADLAAFESETPAPHLRPYLDGLAQWVHGNTNWTASCGRYTP